MFMQCMCLCYVRVMCGMWHVRRHLCIYVDICVDMWVFVDVLCIVCCMDVAWMYVLYRHLFVHVDACMVYSYKYKCL